MISAKGTRESAQNHPAGRAGRQETLLDRFNRDFACVLADQPDLLRQAYETRYQVYCVENAFEDPEEHGLGQEVDAFDAFSVHSLLTFRPTGESLGTVRLVLPDAHTPSSYAMQRLVEFSGNKVPVPLAATAEVSRFSISKRSRKVKGAIDIVSGGGRPALRQAEPLMSLGLIQGLVRMSRANAVTHWCAVMETKLIRMLDAMGIHFTPAGPMLDYHGLRQACYCELEAVLASVKRERPSFWDIITDGGALAAV
jgi:N-acyl amino acid synthase of PEP-CTERM/exosortase system